MIHRFVTSSGARMEFAADDPLAHARRREEILSAQLYALNHVLELFEIVGKETAWPTARKAICEAWRMTELQAQAIIEMQVQRFTRIERARISDELADLQEFIAAQVAS
jgi:DNA gyrase subunit A